MTWPTLFVLYAPFSVWDLGIRNKIFFSPAYYAWKREKNWHQNVYLLFIYETFEHYLHIRIKLFIWIEFSIPTQMDLAFQFANTFPSLLDLCCLTYNIDLANSGTEENWDKIICNGCSWNKLTYVYCVEVKFGAITRVQGNRAFDG